MTSAKTKMNPAAPGEIFCIISMTAALCTLGHWKIAVGSYLIGYAANVLIRWASRYV